jgi:hypothetical protein
MPNAAPGVVAPGTIGPNGIEAPTNGNTPAKKK